MRKLTEHDLANITGDEVTKDFNTCNTASTPQRFKVTITETLKRTVEVEAGDQHEAEQIVSDDWRLGGYILDASDFTEVEFEAVPVIDGHDDVSMEGV